jgi:hypothetical protein
MSIEQALIDFSVEEKTAKIGGGKDIFLETRLRLRITGRPNVGQQS